MKTKDELIDEIKDLNIKVEELIEEIEDLEDRNSGLINECTEAESKVDESEERLKSIFYAGVIAGNNGEDPLRAWINHMIEARI